MTMVQVGGRTYQLGSAQACRQAWDALHSGDVDYPPEEMARLMGVIRAAASRYGLQLPSDEQMHGGGYTRARDPSKPYGDVAYADPGYQPDGKSRYPIDTYEHVKAAWSYINQADNAGRYSEHHLALVKARIVAAAKRFGIAVADDDEATRAFYAVVGWDYPGYLRAAGVDVHPGGEQLKHWWTKTPEGLARWAVLPSGRWTALYEQLLEHMPEAKARLTASAWFKDVFGYSAGSDLNLVASGKPPRGKRIGPG